MDEPVHLTLYVNRRCALEATKNLIKVLGTTKEDIVDLKIIDVGAHPELAEAENVVDTPCLKIERGNEHFMLDDLSDQQEIERALRARSH